MSCSVIAHASASNGSGRRIGRSHGVARTTGPMSGSWRKRSWNGRQVVVDAEREAHPRERLLADVGAARPRAPITTRETDGCAARTKTGSPSTCMSRMTTPPRRRVTPSAPSIRGIRNGHSGLDLDAALDHEGEPPYARARRRQERF